MRDQSVADGRRLALAAARKRFAAAVEHIAADPKWFQRSIHWEEFVADVRNHLAPAMIASARKKIDWHFTAEELPTLILFAFIDHRRESLYIAAPTTKDPFGYAHDLLASWWCEETGRGRYEYAERQWRNAYVSSIDAPGFAGLSSAENVDPLELLIQHEDSRRSIAVKSTVATLLLRTPESIREMLPEIVWWMSAEVLDEAGRRDADMLDAAAHRFPTIDPVWLVSIARAVWGIRPGRRETALYPSFLRDPSFDPLQSPTHFWALRQYRSKMAA